MGTERGTQGAERDTTRRDGRNERAPYARETRGIREGVVSGDRIPPLPRGRLIGLALPITASIFF